MVSKLRLDDMPCVALPDQGSPNFFVRWSHKEELHSPRAGHLAQCDCFEKYYILPNQQILHTIIILFFHYRQNVFVGWNGFAGRIWPAGRSLETTVLEGD